jgi:hypothetical protein
LRKRQRRSLFAAQIIKERLVGLQSCRRPFRDTLLKRLQPLRQRLLAFNAREFIFERRQDGFRLGATAGRGQLRRQLDDAAVPNLQHGGWGLHVY